jgi:dimethylglycine dehydrogenase
MIFGSGAAENYHMRWFERHLPADGSVTVRALGLSLCGLSVAGPNAQKVLAKLTDEDVSTAALPFMAIREMDLGLVPAIVGRVSFTGSLGYEIWVAAGVSALPCTMRSWPLARSLTSARLADVRLCRCG